MLKYKSSNAKKYIFKQKTMVWYHDSVAQLVARLTPDQKAACSSHVGVNTFFPRLGNSFE